MALPSRLEGPFPALAPGDGLRPHRGVHGAALDQDQRRPEHPARHPPARVHVLRHDLPAHGHAAADALSAARPGARKETLVDYLKRVEKLEEIATSFDGVNKSYAIQAGREVRIIVKPDEVNDEVCAKISRDLAKKIEGELTYPGQIKVTVIRESRYVEYAK